MGVGEEQGGVKAKVAALSPCPQGSPVGGICVTLTSSVCLHPRLSASFHLGPRGHARLKMQPTGEKSNTLTDRWFRKGTIRLG